MMNKITKSLIEIVNKIKRCKICKITSFDFIHNVYQASCYLIHHQGICQNNILYIKCGTLVWGGAPKTYLLKTERTINK